MSFLNQRADTVPDTPTIGSSPPKKDGKYVFQFQKIEPKKQQPMKITVERFGSTRSLEKSSPTRDQVDLGQSSQIEMYDSILLPDSSRWTAGFITQRTTKVPTQDSREMVIENHSHPIKEHLSVPSEASRTVSQVMKASSKRD